jgi:hypothetical protein
MKKIIFILFLIIALHSCNNYYEVYEFPYPEYLGLWKDTVSNVDFAFNQSEMYISLTKYQYWGIDDATTPKHLKLSNNLSTTERTFNILKEPYTEKYNTWMILEEYNFKYYLKK